MRHYYRPLGPVKRRLSRKPWHLGKPGRAECFVWGFGAGLVLGLIVSALASWNVERILGG